MRKPFILLFSSQTCLSNKRRVVAPPGENQEITYGPMILLKYDQEMLAGRGVVAKEPGGQDVRGRYFSLDMRLWGREW